MFSRGFELLDADEATLRYMEDEPARYPHADYAKVGMGGITMGVMLSHVPSCVARQAQSSSAGTACSMNRVVAGGV